MASTKNRPHYSWAPNNVDFFFLGPGLCINCWATKSSIFGPPHHHITPTQMKLPTFHPPTFCMHSPWAQPLSALPRRNPAKGWITTHSWSMALVYLTRFPFWNVLLAQDRPSAPNKNSSISWNCDRKVGTRGKAKKKGPLGIYMLWKVNYLLGVEYFFHVCFCLRTESKYTPIKRPALKNNNSVIVISLVGGNNRTPAAYCMLTVLPPCCGPCNIHETGVHGITRAAKCKEINFLFQGALLEGLELVAVFLIQFLAFLLELSLRVLQLLFLLLGGLQEALVLEQLLCRHSGGLCAEANAAERIRKKQTLNAWSSE